MKLGIEIYMETVHSVWPYQAFKWKETEVRHREWRGKGRRERGKRRRNMKDRKDRKARRGKKKETQSIFLLKERKKKKDRKTDGKEGRKEDVGRKAGVYDDRDTQGLRRDKCSRIS